MNLVSPKAKSFTGFAYGDYKIKVSTRQVLIQIILIFLIVFVMPRNSGVQKLLKLKFRSMQAQYPANTNVLYVDLRSVECIGSSQSSDSLPGMILNMKKPIVFKDYLGVAQRYESKFNTIALSKCMQQIFDQFYMDEQIFCDFFCLIGYLLKE